LIIEFSFVDHSSTVVILKKFKLSMIIVIKIRFFVVIYV